MSTSPEEIYTQVIRNLLPTERLRLANLILNDLVQQNVFVLDQSDTWTEQDLVDITNFTSQYAKILFSESEETS